MGKGTEGGRSVKQRDLDAAMRQILLAPTSSGQRNENRPPSKKEPEVRYRLERRR